MACSMIRDAATLTRRRSSALARKCLQAVSRPSRSSGSTFVDWAEWGSRKRDYYPPFERAAKSMAGRQVFRRAAARAQNRQSRADWHPVFPILRLRQSNWNFQTFDWTTDPAYVESKVVVPGQTLGGSECDRSRLKPSKREAANSSSTTASAIPKCRR